MIIIAAVVLIGGILLSIAIGVTLFFVLRKKTKPIDTDKLVALFDPRDEKSVTTTSTSFTIKDKSTSSKDASAVKSSDNKDWPSYPSRNKDGYISIPFNGNAPQITFDTSASLPVGSSASTILQWIRIPGTIKDEIDMITMYMVGKNGDNSGRGISIKKNPNTAEGNEGADPDPEGGNYRIINCCGKDFDTGLTIQADVWTLLAYVYDGNTTFTGYLYDKSKDKLYSKTKNNAVKLNTELTEKTSLFHGVFNCQAFDMGVSAIYAKALTSDEIVNFIHATEP